MLTKKVFIHIVFASLAACSPPVPVEIATPSETIAPTESQAPVQTQTPTPIAYTPIEFWESPVDFEGLWWMEEIAIEDGIRMGVRIYGIDRDTAFLFGSVSVNPGTVHSLLLKTNDGGQSWYQTMEPALGNRVINLQMLENGNGWALLQFLVEGAGSVSLYHTSDFGSSWQFLAYVPEPAWFVNPTLMKFSSNEEGLIHMIFNSGLPESNRVAFLSTIDGGYTWEETGSFPLNGKTKEEIMQQYDAYFEEYEGRTGSVPNEKTSSMDGSQWKIEEGEGQAEVLYVLRRLSEDSEWEIVSILPKHYQYKDGLIISP